MRKAAVILLLGLGAVACQSTGSKMTSGAHEAPPIAVAPATMAPSIGGWVAMWRPLEVFLYDWWPIPAEVKLYDRLAAMPVRVQYTAGGRHPTSDAGP